MLDLVSRSVKAFFSLSRGSLRPMRTAAVDSVSCDVSALFSQAANKKEIRIRNPIASLTFACPLAGTGEPPPTSVDRNWLFVPPPFRQRGVIKDITEIYWLSGPGGWPKPVYGTAKKLTVNSGNKSAYIAEVRGDYV